MKSKHKNQIGIGAVLTYCSIAINIILGIIYTPWMVEQIGTSDYGLYTLASSLIALFLIDIGLGNATSRYVAKYRAEKRDEEISKFLSAIYKLYLILDAVFLLVLLIFFLFIDSIYVSFTPKELERFKVIFCIAGTFSLISFPCATFNGILTACERFIPLKIADMVQRIGAVVLTVIALYLGYGLYSLVLLQVICGLFAIIIKFVYVQKEIHFRFTKHDKRIYKEVFSFSAWSAIYGLTQRLIFNITPTILAITAPTATVSIAIFGIVTTIEGYCYIFTTAINGMFLGKISRIIQKNNSGEELNTLAINVGRFQFALNGLIVIGFTLVGKEFINLWMGSEFELAYYGILLVILPGLFFNALQIFHTTLIARNMVKDQALIQVMMGIMNVILSLIFSYHWGVVGASLAIFVSYTFRFIMTLILIRRKLKVDVISYAKNCYLRMSFAIVLTGILAFSLLAWIRIGSWVLFGIKVITITLIYLITQSVFGLNKRERAFIKSKLSRSH